MASSSSLGGRRRLYALSLHIHSRPDNTASRTGIATCTAAGAAAAAAAIATPDVVAFKTPKDGAALKLHIYTPPGHSPDTDSRPAVVFFFGGGWQGGSPSQFFPHCEWFAQQRGMVAISAEYRTASSHGTSPFDCVADGRSAMRWVRAHASELGVDPSRIAAGGGSAGGHVAAACATCATLDDPSDDTSIDPIPDALILFNPVYDNGPAEQGKNTPGYGHDRVAARWSEISPLHIIESAEAQGRPPPPPSLVLFGEGDPLVPVPTMQRFQVACRNLGSVSELVVYAGQVHGFFNGPRRGDNFNDYFFMALEAADRFLQERRWLSSDNGATGMRSFFGAPAVI